MIYLNIFKGMTIEKKTARSCPGPVARRGQVELEQSNQLEGRYNYLHD